MVKLPAGMTTISGHSGQSRKTCPVRKIAATSVGLHSAALLVRTMFGQQTKSEKIAVWMRSHDSKLASDDLPWPQ
jgi:hypothetical protein